MIKRLTLLLSFVFVFSFVHAQTSDNLKDFIDKNNVAIRSVQKNIIMENSASYDAEFKEVLKQQVAAVKNYNSNKEQSYALAYSVRVSCLEFLKKNTTNSLAYYAINANDKAKVSQGNQLSISILSSNELKMINEMDIKNIQTLNALPLTIQ